jgi:hypothetical protein
MLENVNGMMEEFRSNILSRNKIMKSVRDIARLKTGLRSDQFTTQNNGEAHILSMHINAIYGVIGSDVHEDSFIGHGIDGIVGDKSKLCFDAILQDGNVLKPSRLSTKCLIACEVLDRDKSSMTTKLQKYSATLARMNESYRNDV